MRAIGICWTWNCFQINISFYSKRAAQSENFRMKSQVLVDLVSEKEIISSHFNEFWLWQFKITAGHGQNTRGVISKQHSIQYEFHFHAIASIDTFEIHSIGYWMAAQVQEYKFSFDRVKRFQKPIRFDWIARKAEYWGGGIFLMKGVLQPLGPLCQNIFIIFDNHPLWSFRNKVVDNKSSDISEALFGEQKWNEWFSQREPDVTKETAPVCRGFNEWIKISVFILFAYKFFQWSLFIITFIFEKWAT